MSNYIVTFYEHSARYLKHQLMAGIVVLSLSHNAAAGNTAAHEHTTTETLAGKLRIGDIVFSRVRAYPFRQIAHDTDTWANHVGVVVGESPLDPLIAESAFPLSRVTTLSRFAAHSEKGRMAVMRLPSPLSEAQRKEVQIASLKRMSIFYDTGFDLYSQHREFCSRFAREVIEEATGSEVGKIETLSGLFKENPNANMVFWRIWYFGRIPWQRETVTPASMLNDPQLATVFDGYAKRKEPRQNL